MYNTKSVRLLSRALHGPDRINTCLRCGPVSIICDKYKYHWFGSVSY